MPSKKKLKTLRERQLFFFGHRPNFLFYVRNIWSHFEQSVRKTFAYSTTIARAYGGSMLINLTKIL